MTNARGFTLAELLITMVVMSILGLALARIIINNSDFVSRQDAMMEAREVARSAMNVLSPELRLISDGAVIAAHRGSIRARVPYAFGVICNRVAPTYASILPTDSVMYASATVDGVAWRTDNGYSVDNSVTIVPEPLTALCTATPDSIRVLPGGRVIRISGIQSCSSPPDPDDPCPGTIFYLFQTITYRFRPSTDLPGRRALWRRTGNAASYEELVAPFDTSARFAFLMGPNMRVDTRLNFTGPSLQTRLDSIRGLELWLVGASQYMPRGTSTYQKFDLRPAVGFLNRSN